MFELYISFTVAPKFKSLWPTDISLAYVKSIKYLKTKRKKRKITYEK